MIRSGPVPLGGDSEEEGDFTGGDPPWGMSSLSYIWVPQPCDLMLRR